MAITRDARLLSRPHEVRFAGLRGDTYSMQQAGWQLAAEEDPYGGSVRLAMRHEKASLFAMTNSTRLDYYRFGDSILCFDIVLLHSVKDIVIYETMSRFEAIDAKPSLVSIERTSIDDFHIFARPLVRTQEIIVEPKDVSEALDLIKRLQSKELSEIRERQRARDRRGEIQASPQMKFHAQLLSA
jgi:hypothetical protein